MAETYSDEPTVEERRSSDGLLTDERVKWFGIAVAGLFTSAVLYLLYRILTDFVDYELMAAVFPRFVDAYILVLKIFLVSAVLSLVAGTMVGLGRVSRTKFTKAIATGYVEFFRGTPLLFQIFIIYLGIPAFWRASPEPFPIANWNIPAAIIALTLNHAAYSGEAIKGGITAVPDGQMEAARSLGMSYIDSMREVILPQAARNALAALGNDQVILVKDTSLLTVIAVPEIISVFRNVNSNTFDAWTPIVLVAISYLAITLPLGKLVRYLERRSDWGGSDA
ncbi:amino acid ABC transporter permease [Halorussus halophilus]|uniref:amino acid ABC transporter permease n=1 Tax=Halorussus halophilus TaxID=2650975 RepID=UPI0013015044|nr:amino acid ABC transporter permease [Halorussus halophilus]